MFDDLTNSMNWQIQRNAISQLWTYRVIHMNVYWTWSLTEMVKVGEKETNSKVNHSYFLFRSSLFLFLRIYDWNSRIVSRKRPRPFPMPFIAVTSVFLLLANGKTRNVWTSVPLLCPLLLNAAPHSQNSARYKFPNILNTAISSLSHAISLPSQNNNNNSPVFFYFCFKAVQYCLHYNGNQNHVPLKSQPEECSKSPFIINNVHFRTHFSVSRFFFIILFLNTILRFIATFHWRDAGATKERFNFVTLSPPPSPLNGVEIFGGGRVSWWAPRR